jgi:hypothetical protein
LDNVDLNLVANEASKGRVGPSIRHWVVREIVKITNVAQRVAL